MSKWRFELRDCGFLGDTHVPMLKEIFTRDDGIEIEAVESRDSYLFKYRSRNLQFEFSAKQKAPSEALESWRPLRLGPDCAVFVGSRSFSRELEADEKDILWATIADFLGNFQKSLPETGPLAPLRARFIPIETLELLAGPLGGPHRTNVGARA